MNQQHRDAASGSQGEPMSKERADAYEAWLFRRWPDNAQARAIYWHNMNTRSAFCAGEQWARAPSA